jgi:hypothetical protein
VAPAGIAPQASGRKGGSRRGWWYERCQTQIGERVFPSCPAPMGLYDPLGATLQNAPMGRHGWFTVQVASGSPIALPDDTEPYPDAPRSVVDPKRPASVCGGSMPADVHRARQMLQVRGR